MSLLLKRIFVKKRVLGFIVIANVLLFAIFTWFSNASTERIVYVNELKECHCDQKEVTTRQNVTIKPLNIQQNKNERWSAIATQYHKYVNTVQVKCNSIIRLGNADDGGWDICDDEQYRPKQPCLIYSFGIKDDWSFDDATSTKYGCHVHSFDPSLKENDHNRSSLIHFHKLGLAERNYKNKQGWTLKTLAQIRKDLGHSQTELKILKMDIEKSELTAIPEMINSGALNDVTEFVFEIHIRVSKSYEPEADIEKYEMGLKLLKQIYDKGFRIFKTNQNEWSKYKSRFGGVRYGCHELSWLRV